VLARKIDAGYQLSQLLFGLLRRKRTSFVGKTADFVLFFLCRFVCLFLHLNYTYEMLKYLKRAHFLKCNFI